MRRKREICFLLVCCAILGTTFSNANGRKFENRHQVRGENETLDYETYKPGSHSDSNNQQRLNPNSSQERAESNPPSRRAVAPGRLFSEFNDLDDNQQRRVERLIALAQSIAADANTTSDGGGSGTGSGGGSPDEGVDLITERPTFRFNGTQQQGPGKEQTSKPTQAEAPSPLPPVNRPPEERPIEQFPAPRPVVGQAPPTSVEFEFDSHSGLQPDEHEHFRHQNSLDQHEVHGQSQFVINSPDNADAAGLLSSLTNSLKTGHQQQGQLPNQIKVVFNNNPRFVIGSKEAAALAPEAAKLPAFNDFRQPIEQRPLRRAVRQPASSMADYEPNESNLNEFVIEDFRAKESRPSSIRNNSTSFRDEQQIFMDGGRFTDDGISVPLEKMMKSGFRPPLRMFISLRSVNGNVMQVPVNFEGSKMKPTGPNSAGVLANSYGGHLQTQAQRKPSTSGQDSDEQVDNDKTSGRDFFSPNLSRPFPANFRPQSNSTSKTKTSTFSRKERFYQQQQQQQLQEQDEESPKKVDQKRVVMQTFPVTYNVTKSFYNPGSSSADAPYPPRGNDQPTEQTNRQEPNEEADCKKSKHHHKGQRTDQEAARKTKQRNFRFASPKSFAPSFDETPNNNNRTLVGPVNRPPKSFGSSSSEGPASSDQEDQAREEQYRDLQEDLMVALMASAGNKTGGNSNGLKQMQMTVIRPPNGTSVSEIIRQHSQQNSPDPNRMVAILKAPRTNPQNLSTITILGDPPKSLQEESGGFVVQPMMVISPAAASSDGARNADESNDELPDDSSIPGSGNDASDEGSSNDDSGFDIQDQSNSVYSHLISPDQPIGYFRVKRSASSKTTNNTTTTPKPAATTTTRKTSTTTKTPNVTTTTKSPPPKASSAKKAGKVPKRKLVKATGKATSNSSRLVDSKKGSSRVVKLDKGKRATKRMLLAGPRRGGLVKGLESNRIDMLPAASENSQMNEDPEEGDGESDDEPEASDSNDEAASANPYGDNESDSDSDSDSDSEGDGDDTSGFVDSDDEPYNQGASSERDYNSPSFEIPQIDINPDTLKQQGCKTVLREVQEIPMDGLAVVQSDGRPGSGYSSSSSPGDQLAAASSRNRLAGVRVRRDANNLINSRKVTSIVMTKECHFPNEQPAAKPVASNYKRSQFAVPPIQQQQQQPVYRPLPANNYYYYQHAPKPAPSMNLNNAASVKPNRPLPAGVINQAPPNQQANQIKRRSVPTTNNYQPTLNGRPSGQVPLKPPGSLRKPEVGRDFYLGSDSKRNEVVARKLYKPPSADDPFHTLSYSSKTGNDPDMDSDSDDAMLSDGDESTGSRGKGRNRKQTAAAASQGMPRMSETLNERERKALADPNYDDTDPIVAARTDSDEDLSERAPSDESDESDADLSDESRNKKVALRPGGNLNYEHQSGKQPRSRETTMRRKVMRPRGPNYSPSSYEQRKPPLTSGQMNNQREGAGNNHYKRLEYREQPANENEQQRFGKSFKFEHQVGRMPPNGLMAQLSQLRPGRQSYVKIDQGQASLPVKGKSGQLLKPAAGRRLSEEADEEDDGDEEEAPATRRRATEASADEEEDRDDPDSDPEYNPKELHLPAHTKPKRVQKSFAYVHRDLPRKGSKNNDDFVVSYGRGNLQTEHEDYDSDRPNQPEEAGQQQAGSARRLQQVAAPRQAPLPVHSAASTALAIRQLLNNHQRGPQMVRNMQPNYQQQSMRLNRRQDLVDLTPAQTRTFPLNYRLMELMQFG